MSSEPEPSNMAVEGFSNRPSFIVGSSVRPRFESLKRDAETLVALPPGWEVETVAADDVNEDTPRRSRGVSKVHDATSFVTAVNRRRSADGAPPVIYADAHRGALVAVINDDLGDDPGWRDYRVALELIRTPEWANWIKHNAQLMDQTTFAEFIEDSLVELVNPSAAVMLELAQTFHAHTTAKFKGGQRLADGRRQFVYEEDIDAAAGGSGQIAIPERLEIRIAPFYGSQLFDVGAWFRYRLNRDVFTLGYKLDRPHEVERSAFDDVRNTVEAQLEDMEFVSGPAPEPTKPRSAADTGSLF